MEPIELNICGHHRAYEAFWTTAPRDFDYHTTIDLYEQKTDTGVRRIVLIPKGSAQDFQQGRYGSGLYTLEPLADWEQGSAKSLLSERIWEHLEGK